MTRHGPLVSALLQGGVQARTVYQARILIADPAIAKLPPHCRRKRQAVDPESTLRVPAAARGRACQSRTVQATITTFCPPLNLYRLRPYKNARRRTARALSQHFANLYSLHTKLENDSKWWASKRASWRFLGHFERENGFDRLGFMDVCDSANRLSTQR